MGADKVTIPGENATDEEKLQFLHKMGMPETADNYKLLDEGAEPADKTFFDAFKAEAFKLGILPKQAQELVSFYDKYSGDQYSTYKATAEREATEAMDALKTEWGDGYETKIALAKSAMATFADEGFIKMLNETKLGNNPQLIKLFAEVGKGMSEDKIDGESIPSGSARHTPEEAQSRINNVMADLDGAYFNSDHPNHENAVKEMTKLFAMTA